MWLTTRQACVRGALHSCCVGHVCGTCGLERLLLPLVGNRRSLFPVLPPPPAVPQVRQGARGGLQRLQAVSWWWLCCSTAFCCCCCCCLHPAAAATGHLLPAPPQLPPLPLLNGAALQQLRAPQPRRLMQHSLSPRPSCLPAATCTPTAPSAFHPTAVFACFPGKAPHATALCTRHVSAATCAPTAPSAPTSGSRSGRSFGSRVSGIGGVKGRCMRSLHVCSRTRCLRCPAKRPLISHQKRASSIGGAWYGKFLAGGVMHS